jgi:uncharacterized Tic20 family protein
MENNESNNAEEAAFETVSSEPEGPSRTERQWAMGCHLIALGGIVVPGKTYVLNWRAPCC